ncbi:MAG TPA: Rne/Rng family ribonuclease, partial [Micromonosporaceae bacterium]|nr:Rne/Rng family ribonuclease [Micromonosporaceae bacterium]
RAEPARAEPARAEPARAEPARAEPARAEPARAEPAQAEPEPAGAQGGRDAGSRGRARLSAAAVLFMPPSEQTAPPPADEPVEAAEPARARRRRSRRTAEQAEAAEVVEAEEPAAPVAEPVAAADEDEEEDEDELTAAGRRRRRRGRRGRGRGRGPHDDEDEDVPAAAEEADEAGDAGEPDAESDGLTRRRRRRRRKGASDVDQAADDGVLTVVKIREPRGSSDEVQGVSGSTRLEAKRQRRRDGREQRRTRPPILSEAEFLARREAVDRVMAVRQKGDRTQIAVIEDGVLVEHYVTRASAGAMAGNVYLGRVQNVLPSMEAAFVDIGRGRNAVLYAGEVNWDASGLEGRARSIEQALRSGDSVLVQVTKDPVGHKGARLTSHIALSGRHLVYVPHGNASGISRKLPDTERKRLRDVLKKLVPEGAGVIVRTAAEGASEDELARDVKRLQAQWDDISAKAAASSAPVLLYEEPDLVIRVVRDLFNEDFRELVISGDDEYDVVEAYLQHVSPDLVGRLRRHTGAADVFAEKRIDEQILKGLDRKVFLPSGGHLVIDRTEAMTVIDVNTGKYTGAGGNLEETVTRNNLEAAEEIVRQLRLRDIGGIIVIDFIDMVLESNRELVLRRLTECLGRDRTKHQVTEITSLGLVQMTRKRIGQGLLEAFSETCEACKGRGLLLSSEPVSDKPRAGTGDRGKAAGAAPAKAEGRSDTGRTRTRRGRRGTGEEEPEYAESAAADEDALPDPDDPEVSDDPIETEDAEPVTDDDEDDAVISSGRRRARRSGVRRRTRP